MQTKPLHLDVHEQIECAHTLASRFYTNPAILEIEKSRIFQRTWQLVGTLSQSCGEVNGVKRAISDPESFFTADVAGEPIIVVGDSQGTLRAFSNVCRHRAGPIALGSSCKNVQRGLRSSTYDRGRYSVKRENGVHHFHMLLGEFLGNEAPSNQRPEKLGA